MRADLPARRSTRGLSATVGFALLLSSCSPADTASESPGELDRLKVVVMPYLSQMPFHIAKEEGYFVEEGVEPEFVRVGRNQELMAALALGEVDAVAGLLTVNELSAMAAGVRVRVVATLAELDPNGCTFLAVIAKRGLEESGALESPDRVRGLIVDTDTLTPLGYQVDLVLRRYGLGLDDVELINLPPPSGLGAMQEGSVQAIIENEPFLSQHLLAGTATIWVPVEEVAPNYPHSVLLYGRRLLDERPDVGERFAKALMRGIHRFREGKTERNMQIVERASGLSTEILERACWPVGPDDAAVNTRAIRGYQEWSVARGLLERVLEEDQLYDARFMTRASKALSP